MIFTPRRKCAGACIFTWRRSSVRGIVLILTVILFFVKTALSRFTGDQYDTIKKSGEVPENRVLFRSLRCSGGDAVLRILWLGKRFFHRLWSQNLEISAKAERIMNLFSTITSCAGRDKAEVLDFGKIHLGETRNDLRAGELMISFVFKNSQNQQRNKASQKLGLVTVRQRRTLTKPQKIQATHP